MRHYIGFLPFWWLPAAALVAGVVVEASPSLQSQRLSNTENEPFASEVFSLLHEAYRRIGIDVSLASLPGERSILLTNTGKFDGDLIHAQGVEKRYPNLIMVPVPLLYVDAVAFTSGQTLPLSGWASLAKYHVCIRRGIKVIELATAEMNNIVVVDQYKNIFDMIKARHCDVGILLRHAWIEAQRLHITGLVSQEPPLGTWPLYHYVNKSHADIVPELSKTLMQMQKEGLLAKTQTEYMDNVEKIRREQEFKQP